MRDPGRINEAYLERDVGSIAIFKCKSQEKPYWYFHGDRIYRSNDFLIKRSTLIIKDVKLHHYGRYTCLGNYENHVKFFYTYASLKVYGKLCYKFIYTNVIKMRYFYRDPNS